MHSFVNVPPVTSVVNVEPLTTILDAHAVPSELHSVPRMYSDVLPPAGTVTIYGLKASPQNAGDAAKKTSNIKINFLILPRRILDVANLDHKNANVLRVIVNGVGGGPLKVQLGHLSGGKPRDRDIA